MARVHHPTIAAGVALHAASLLLLELLVFRLGAPTVGHELAYLVALGAPAAVGLGAVAFAPRVDGVQPRALVRRAVIWSVASGGTWIVALLALTWLSGTLVIRRAELSPALALGLVALWFLPSASSGAALAILLRLGVGRIGRLGFAEAVGAALVGLCVPLAMGFGAPRMALIGALMPALAAMVLAWPYRASTADARRARPSWSVLVTLPLALVALLAGDLGAPWLEFRTRPGRRDKPQQFWTAEGLLSVQRVRGRWMVAIDGIEASTLGRAKTAAPKPEPAPIDLAFGLGGAGDEPMLVVGSAGGREVQSARIRGMTQVTVLERSATIAQRIMSEQFAPHTDQLYVRTEGLQLRVGDGRAGLPPLPASFDRILVVGADEMVHAPPRLIVWSDRLLTRAAMGAYLQRLAPKGVLVLRSRSSELGAVARTALAALGVERERGRDHLFACTDGKGGAALLVRVEPLTGGERKRLQRFCKNRRLTPLGDSKKSAAAAEARAGKTPPAAPRAPWLGNGSDGMATDDRPFLAAPPSGSELARGVPQGIRVLLGQAESSKAPEADESPARKRPGPRSGRRARAPFPDLGSPGSGGRPGVIAQPSPETAMALTLAWVGLLSLLGLLVAGLRIRRLPTPQRAPVARCLGLAAFGVGLALAQLVLTDMVVRLLGHTAYGWGLAIPLGLAGVGVGRLWVDTVKPGKARRAMIVVSALGVVLVVLVHALAPWLGQLADSSGAVRLGVALPLLLLLGALLGAPLAAGLRRLAGEHHAAVSWGFGLHTLGWALGGALGALLSRFVGLRDLLWLAALAVVVGALTQLWPRRARAAAAPAAQPPTAQPPTAQSPAAQAHSAAPQPGA